jgi:branched-chain amino acid transport system permease protein
MAILIQQLFNGIALGLVYSLVAVGYSLVFGILRLINFSHGSVYAFGAHMAFVVVGFGLGPVLGIIVSIIVTGFLGIFIDKIALVPLRRKKSMGIAALVTTLGISNIIQHILVLIFGSHRKAFPDFYNFGLVAIFGVQISSRQFIMLGVSLMLLLLLFFIVHKTKIGLAMRATSQNQKAASLMGINVNSVSTTTFFMSGASAAIAGGLVAGYYQVVYPGMGFMIGLKAFAASVLGGIGSLPGALLGGLLVGIMESVAALYIGSNYRDAMAFIILIIVLIFKPAGIFGKKDVIKV